MAVQQCDGGRGHQQEDDAGTRQCGAVTQVPFTARHGTSTCYTGLAALGNHVVTVEFERVTAVEDDGARFGVNAGPGLGGCARVASQSTRYTETQKIGPESYHSSFMIMFTVSLLLCKKTLLAAFCRTFSSKRMSKHEMMKPW